MRSQSYFLPPLFSFRRTRLNGVLIVLFGIGVVFASLGLGEAVYRVLFLQFDGATDRLPLEMAAGIAFAYLSTRLIRRIHQRRLDARERIESVRRRNEKIRNALEAIVPAPLPGHQQAIRVIREEVDRIEYTLCDIVPAQSEELSLRELLATLS